MVERKKGETWNENLIFRRNVTTEFNDIAQDSNILLDFTIKSGAVYTATQNRSSAQNLGTELSNVVDFYNTWIIDFCGQIRTVIGYIPSEDTDGVVIGRFTLDSAFSEEPATGSNMSLIDPDKIIDAEQVVLKVDTDQQVQLGGENNTTFIHNKVSPLGIDGLTKYLITDDTVEFFVDFVKPVKTDSINVATLCTQFGSAGAGADSWLEQVGIFLDSVPADTKMRYFFESSDTINRRYPLIENVTIDEFNQGLGDPVSVSTFADVSTWNLTDVRIPSIIRITNIFRLTFSFSDSNGDPVFLDVPVDNTATDSPFFRTVRENNIQSASGTAITLDTGADPADDSYNAMRLYDDNGEFRDILDYNGTTKVATIDSAFTITPSASDPYQIKIAFIRPMMVFESKVTEKSQIQDKHNRREFSFSDDGALLEIGTVNRVDTTDGPPTFNIPVQNFQSIGGWFEIIDKESTFDDNNVIIDFDIFDNFEGAFNTDFVCDLKNARYIFRYVDNTFGWTVEIDRGHTFHDCQHVEVVGPLTTTSATFVDITGLTLTTKDLGQDTTYMVWVDLELEHSQNNSSIDVQICFDGVVKASRTVSFGPNSANDPHDATLIAKVGGVEEGRVIQIQWKTPSGTATLNIADLLINGIPTSRII